MIAIILATLMSLPIYPLNPTAQDTINTMNLHITAGINGPSSSISSGPEATVKYELMLFHPFVFRGSFDYRYGSVNTNVFPNGDLHRFIVSVEVLFYRGTKSLTGYIGGGVIYAMHSFQIRQSVADSLYNNFDINDVSITSVPGYRITAGIRIHRIYSIEIGITEIYPEYVYTEYMPDNRYASYQEKFRFNDFRVSFGYLFTLKI